MLARLLAVNMTWFVLSTTYGADWQPLPGTESALAYVDRESIAPRGKYMRAWVMLDYFSPQKTQSYPQREYRSGKYLWAFDCVEKRWAAIQGVNLTGDGGQGEVVESTSVDWSLARFVDVVPESLAEGVLRRVCAARQGLSPASPSKQ